MAVYFYDVCVADIDRAQRRVNFDVTVIYYDVSAQTHAPLCNDASLFARLLQDRQDRQDRHASKIAPALQDKRLHDEAYLDSNAWRFIESVKQLEIRFEITDWSKFDRDERNFVEADYEVIVTDARWIAHLQRGDRWESTAYPTAADRPTAETVARLPDLRLEARRLVPFAGRAEFATPHEVTFSDDGRLLAITSEAGGLVVYDTATWQETMRVSIDARLPHAEFFPDSHVLAMRSKSSKYFGNETWSGDAKTGNAATVELAPGQRRSRSGLLRAEYYDNHDEALDLLDEHGTVLRRIDPGGAIDSAAFSPDEGSIAIAGWNERISIWSCANGEQLGELVSEAEHNTGLAFSPSGEWLAVCTRRVSIFDLRTKTVVRRSGEGFPETVAWSERYVAVTWTRDGAGGYVTIHELGASWDD